MTFARDLIHNDINKKKPTEVSQGLKLIINLLRHHIYQILE